MVYPHVRASGAERVQRRRGRRRAWEGRANFVTDATKSRLEEGGRVSSLPCEPGRSYHSPGGGGGAEGGSYHLWDKGAWTSRSYQSSGWTLEESRDCASREGSQVDGLHWGQGERS